jgi:hypothetical protein
MPPGKHLDGEKLHPRFSKARDLKNRVYFSEKIA